jgi:hypothetical protein
MAERFFDAGLEERLEGWLDRGREFVDGVAGARPGSRRPSKRPLDAISRRLPAQESWPNNDIFTTPHWQRPEPKPAVEPTPDPAPSSRPMPRSHRRRNT